MELIDRCPSFKLLNLNTDGLMYSVNRSELPLVDAICAAWEQRTRFELETDHIQEVYIKDVNNLLFIDTDGKYKTVGGYLNYGISEKGGWAINNTHTIVKKAVVQCFTRNIPVEETIYGSDDIHEFQIVAKAGGGYDAVYRVPPNYEDIKKSWERENRFRATTKTGKATWKTPPWRWDCYEGPRSSVQKVNRVYASKNPNMGSLVKVKSDGTVGKIAGLPDSCIIDNKNSLTLNDIDRDWYVALAKKYISDYTGIT